MDPFGNVWKLFYGTRRMKGELPGLTRPSAKLHGVSLDTRLSVRLTNLSGDRVLASGVRALGRFF